jgi:rubrerythrin
MWEKERQIVVATHLEKYERLLSEVYKIFAKKFEPLSSFWNEIAVEENTHALMIATLKSMIYDGSQFFENRDYKVPNILQAIDKIKAYMTNIEKKDITIESAIEFALFVEGAPLEKDIFKTMDGDSDEVKRILSILYEDTKRHYNKIQKLSNKITQQSKKNIP